MAVEAERWRRLGLPVLTWSLAAAPAAWLLLFALFVLRARLALGRWPAPYRPDPKDLGFSLHHTAIVVGMPLMFVAVLWVTVLALSGRSRPGRRWLVPLIAWAGLVAVVLLARADPGGLVTWLGD
jgi:hypothetical protein